MSELDRASLDRTLPPRSGSADWDEVLRGAGAGRERRGRRLVAVVAALLVLVVGTASAFGTVRDLFGNGTRGGGAFHAMEGKRGSFFLRDVSITDAAGNPITDAAGNRSRGWRIEVRLGRSGSYGPVRASHRARTVCRTPPDQVAEVVARTPRGLRDPPGRSDAARRDHREGWRAGRVRAHPATARDSEARLRHGEHHAQVSQAGRPAQRRRRRGGLLCRARVRPGSGGHRDRGQQLLDPIKASLTTASAAGSTRCSSSGPARSSRSTDSATMALPANTGASSTP